MSDAMRAGYSRRRVLLALAISVIPIGALRLWAYRALLGYRIGRGAKIAPMNLIACEEFTTGPNFRLGRGNRFIGPFRASFGEDVHIGRFNEFACGPSAASAARAHMNYARRLVVGDNVLINDRHYFNLYGLIRIGRGTWIAGRDSQFWTHGATAPHPDIAIGDDCYLGSAIRVVPGGGVGDRCVVGVAAVVVSNMAETDAVIVGFPAKKLRDISPDDARQFVFEKF